MKNIKQHVAYAISVIVWGTASYVGAISQINSPLDRSISSFPALISAILKAMVMIALPIIGLAIVYVGFLFIWARGNATELAKAKRAFWYTMLGAILILGAWLLANLIGNTVSQVLPN